MTQEQRGSEKAYCTTFAGELLDVLLENAAAYWIVTAAYYRQITHQVMTAANASLAAVDQVARYGTYPTKNKKKKKNWAVSFVEKRRLNTNVNAKIVP